nr:alpha/beta family hydrolase [Hyphomicrobium sp. 99]
MRSSMVREIEILPRRLGGFLAVPKAAMGVVVFVHGSGSSRFSPRNTSVSHALNRAGLATLLFDLLLPEEAEDRQNVFDIPLLVGRVEESLDWIQAEEAVAHLPVGLFGASTGAAAALMAAARQPDQVSAVVSRGGRPDLAGEALAGVKAPTLLIVGGRDELVIELNRAALTKLRCEKRLDIVPGASHLFEEPGTLDAVVSLASAWFRQFFKKD